MVKRERPGECSGQGVLPVFLREKRNRESYGKGETEERRE